MRWVGELARRKVLKVGAVYLATAWVLLQLTDIVAPALELPAWTLKFVLLLLVLGFPVAVVLAWQFNLTERGLQAESAAPGKVPRTRKRDWVLLGLIAVLGIGVGVAAQRMLTSFAKVAAPAAATASASPATTATTASSVAVLPFVNMGGVAEDGYFADGLSEEILNSLANVPGLKVAGRTSSFSYKGRDQDIRKIGRELGVAHVIEGSVRRQGDKLRVTAQLIKADDGFHLWSQTFDRTLEDAFVIQREVANAVAEKLKLSVLPTSSATAQLDSVSQHAYLQALGLIGESSEASLEKAVALLRPLQKAHPDFIPTYLPLADSVQRLGWFGRLPRLQSVEEMRALSAEATRRAPGDLDVRVLSALISFAVNDLAPSYRGYERILATHRMLAEEAPNHALLQLNTSDAARMVGQHELALRYADRYVALEPRDPKGYWTIGMTARAAGREAEAIAALRRAIAVSPRFYVAYWDLSRLLTRAGRFMETLDLAESCQRAGGRDCPGLLSELYRVLRQPALEQQALRLSTYPTQAKSDAFDAARRRGGYHAALAWIGRQGAEASGLKRDFGDDLATAALEDGEHEVVIQLHRWLGPGIFESDAPLLSGYEGDALEVGVALLRLGRTDEARQMFQRALDSTRRAPPMVRTRSQELPEATALVWLGQIDQAMAVIRREVANGWIGEYDLTHTVVGTPDPLMEPLRDDPEFQRLMREVRARNANAFAALKASGRPLLPNLKPTAADVSQR